MVVLKEWILNHDEKTAFTILYIGLSLVLSIVFGLFWLVLIVFLHWVLELIVHSLKPNKFLHAIGNSIWEIKLDIALVLMALWLAIYLDFIFGFAGLGVAARTVTQISNQTIRSGSRIASTGSNIAKTTVRFAGWQRLIRSTLLSIDDVIQSFRGIFKAKKNKITIKENQKPIKIRPDEKLHQVSINLWKVKWKKGDFASVMLIFLFFILILMAPQIIGKSFNDVIQILVNELKP